MRKSDLKRFTRSLIPVILFMGMLAALGPPVKAADPPSPTAITENTDGNQYGTPVDGQFGGAVSSWVITVPGSVDFKVGKGGWDLVQDMPVKASLMLADADAGKYLEVTVTGETNGFGDFVMANEDTSKTDSKLYFDLESPDGRQALSGQRFLLFHGSDPSLTQVCKVRLLPLLEPGSFKARLTFTGQLSQ